MVGIDRINKILEKNGERFLNKFLSQDEMRLCKTAKTVAGFWASKEAVSKALGVGIGSSCSFFDIHLSKNDCGAPVVKLSSKVKKAFNVKNCHISITHSEDIAIAVAIINREH